MNTIFFTCHQHLVHYCIMIYVICINNCFCCCSFNMFFSIFSANKCPDHIDCARKGRHFCKTGSSHCGPCLSPLEEDNAGHCVAPRTHFLQQHHQGMKAFTHSPYPPSGYCVTIYLAPIAYLAFALV